jgi:hypothetical protein
MMHIVINAVNNQKVYFFDLEQCHSLQNNSFKKQNGSFSMILDAMSFFRNMPCAKK